MTDTQAGLLPLLNSIIHRLEHDWNDADVRKARADLIEFRAAFTRPSPPASGEVNSAQKVMQRGGLRELIQEALTAKFDDGREEYLLRHGVIRAGFTQTVNATKNYENRLIASLQAAGVSGVPEDAVLVTTADMLVAIGLLTPTSKQEPWFVRLQEALIAAAPER